MSNYPGFCVHVNVVMTDCTVEITVGNVGKCESLNSLETVLYFNHQLRDINYYGWSLNSRL